MTRPSVHYLGAIPVSPDLWAYDQLAKNYKVRGDVEHWQSTLEEFIAKTEDHGLNHSTVNIQLATHFMELKKWDQATHFAEAAAQSGSGAAMLCAQQLAEGREDWMAAERFAQQLSERYPDGSWANWFLFCKRTGHGDLQSARGFADKWLEPIDQRPDLADPATLGYFYWLSGDTKKAMTCFRKGDRSNPNAYTCFNLILLGDEIGDTEARDETVRILLKSYRGVVPKACQVDEILRNSFGQPKPASVDLKAIDAVLVNSPPMSQGLNSWLVGLYLRNHGKPEDARRYLNAAMKLPGVHEWGQCSPRGCVARPW